MDTYLFLLLSAVGPCKFIPRLSVSKRHFLSVSVSRIGLILLAFSAATGAADQASHLSRAAARAQRKGDTLQAYQLYSRAAALDPSKPEYALHRSLLRDWAALSAQASLAEPGDDA